MKDWTSAHTQCLDLLSAAVDNSSHSMGGGLVMCSLRLLDRINEEPVSSILASFVDRGLIKAWGRVNLYTGSDLDTYAIVCDPSRHVFVFSCSSVTQDLPDEG
jgi:hypothetical protein